MIDVYDNGSLMLGKVSDVIEEIEKEIQEDLDMCFISTRELVKDLKENYESTDIVCIEYDSGMDYNIWFWTQRDNVRRDV